MDKAAYYALAWLVASAVLNAVFTFRTPEQWESFVERSPRGAALVKALRKIGLDLPGLVRLVLEFIRRKAGRA